MTPELGKWYRVWRARWIGDEDAGGYFAGELVEVSEDGDYWLVGDDGEELACDLRDLEEVP